MTGTPYRAEDGGGPVVNGAVNRPECTWPRWREELWWAAIAFAAHRWAILPGTYPDHAAQWQGRPNPVGMRPVHEHWAPTRPPRLAQVAHRWTAQPYSMLLGCGHNVDALELPATTADPVLAALRPPGRRPPAMLTPTGTRMPLPPTSQHQGNARNPGYRWVPEHSPPYLGWDLPELAKINHTTTIRRRQAEEVPMDNQE